MRSGKAFYIVDALLTNGLELVGDVSEGLENPTAFKVKTALKCVEAATALFVYYREKQNTLDWQKWDQHMQEETAQQKLIALDQTYKILLNEQSIKQQESFAVQKMENENEQKVRTILIDELQFVEQQLQYLKQNASFTFEEQDELDALLNKTLYCYQSLIQI